MGYLQMTRNVESIFGAVVTAPHQIPYTYTATGGEKFISLPFYPVTGIVTINGGMQVPLDNFEIEGNTLNLGRALSKGDVVFCLFDKILSPEDYKTGIRIYKFQAIGGETEFTPDYTSYGVQSLYIGGEYKTPEIEYSYDNTTGKVSLQTALTAGVWVVAEMSVKQPNISPLFDRSIQEIARSANVKDSEVILSTDTTQSLNGKNVIYSVSEQKSYGLPVLPTDVYIHSVANGKLTYNPGSVIVDLLPVPGSVEEFKDNLTLNVGASTIGTESGKTVQEELDTLEETSVILKNSIYKPIPVKYSPDYSQVMVASVNPQGLAQDATYWYITEDTSSGGAYTCTLSRINKVTNAKETFPGTFGTHGQGIGILSSGEVFIGGATNSSITVINFTAGTSSQVACIGFMKDFPFCYDSKTDLIYQLQDADGTTANITRIAVLSRTAGFISDNSIDRKLVKPGYPQGITTDGSFLYVTCGNSWSAASTGTWNDYWACFKVSLTGQVIERAMFRRNSMGVLAGGITVTSHEPQAVSWFEGKLSFLQYIGSSSATNAVIFTEDSEGSAIRAIPKNLWVSYYSLDELGINTASLVAGSALSTIAAAMPDNSDVTFSISNEAALLADTGIGFGVCKITRVNANRINAVTTEASSGLTPSQVCAVSYVGIYGSVQSAPKFLRGVKPVALAYEGTIVATAPSTITVSGIANCNELVIHITHTSGDNPVTPYKFTRDEISYYVTNATTLYIGDGTGYMSCRFTATGLSITGVTGSLIVRRVLTM